MPSLRSDCRECLGNDWLSFISGENGKRSGVPMPALNPPWPNTHQLDTSLCIASSNESGRGIPSSLQTLSISSVLM